jgi:hypothetical protein
LETDPQFVPAGQEVFGVQHLLASQIWPTEHESLHWIIPPQPSETDPQFVPAGQEVSGVQACAGPAATMAAKQALRIASRVNLSICVPFSS